MAPYSDADRALRLGDRFRAKREQLERFSTRKSRPESGLDCLIFSFESGWGARWKRRSAPCQGRWCGVSHPLGSSQGPRHSPTVGSTAGSCLSGTRYLYTHHCRGTLQLSFGSFRFSNSRHGRALGSVGHAQWRRRSAPCRRRTCGVSLGPLPSEQGTT